MNPLNFARSICKAFTLAFLVAVMSPKGEAAAHQTNEEVSYIAVVKGNDVYVRCNASETFYPFGKVNEGDLVKVTAEKFDWARVATIGPAFSEMFGYVKFAKGDTSKVRLSPEGKTAVTLGKVDIVAPNLQAKFSPKDSWKPIAQLQADQTLQIIGTVESDKETILKVALPATGQGWINLAYLEKAGEEQISRWKDLMAAKPVAPAAQPAPAGDKATASRSTSPAQSPPPAPRVQPNTPVTVPPASDAKPTSDSMNQVPATGTPESADTSADASKPEDNRPVEASAAPARPSGPPSLEDLEAAFKVLQREPAETAEVSQLREMYLDLAKRIASDPVKSKRALGRADQLQVWADVQKKRQELNEARARLKLSAADAALVQKALESSAQYIAVGRVVASPIYDGQRLPKLLRVQDAATNRTIAYLQPDEKYELVNLVGNLVGIVGEKNYDESLRLNIITPKRIDILTPDKNAAAAASGSS
jgi:hypothetical protein